MIKIASEKEILSFFKNSYASRKEKYYGFYSSTFNHIITNQHYMLLPVDDRTATRAHGVFDVVYLKNKKLQNLQQHVQRLHNSAKSYHIDPPFTVQHTKNIIVEVVENVVDFHLRNNPNPQLKDVFNDSIGVRLTISSGYGDLSVASLGLKSVLYIIVFQPYIPERVIMHGVKEYVTMTVNQPKQHTQSKGINYSENALMANLAKEKGGYQGIKALPNRVLLQAASANIGFIFGKEFAAPRFETVIEGTTIKRSLNFIENLVKKGVLEKISFRDITIEEGEKANQMILFGGDKVVPVLEFNDKVISKQKGPITHQIQEWYISMNDEGTPIKIDPLLL